MPDAGYSGSSPASSMPPPARIPSSFPLPTVRVHPWCGRPLDEHPPEARLPNAPCPFPAQAPIEFAVDTEPRVRVVGLPDTVHLPGDVLEALDHLARVCRTAYGMGVEVTAYDDDEVRAALETIRRRLDL